MPDEPDLFIFTCSSCGVDLLPNRDDKILQERIPKAYACPACGTESALTGLKFKSASGDKKFPVATPIFDQRHFGFVPPSQRKSSEGLRSERCQSLFEAATPLLYRQNAFRITGLQVEATARELKRRIDDLKNADEFGDAHEEHTATFSIAPAPSFDQIRKAAQKLQDPEKRIIDEFFWFWPLRPNEGKTDTALLDIANGNKENALEKWQAWQQSPNHAERMVGLHNIAVMYHLMALDSEQINLSNDVTPSDQTSLFNWWIQATNCWTALQDDEEIWNRITERIRQINDPRLPTNFTHLLKNSLREALTRIHLFLAVHYAEKGNSENALLHMRAVNNRHNELSEVQASIEEIAEPYQVRIKTTAEQSLAEAQTEPEKGVTQAINLLQATEQPRRVIKVLFTENDHNRIDAFDLIIDHGRRCLVSYGNKTNDWTPVLPLLNTLQSLIPSPEVALALKKDIFIVEQNIEHDVWSKPAQEYTEKIIKLDNSKESIGPRLNQLEIIVKDFMEKIAHRHTCDGLLLISARTARSMAIDAWNNFKDWKTSDYALTTAFRFHSMRHEKDAALEKQLALDRITLNGNKTATGKKAANSGWGCLTLLAIAILYGLLASNHSNNSYTPPRPAYTHPVYAPPPPKAEPPVPPMALPTSGQWIDYANRPFEAPFKIIAGYGTNYFVKLFDWNTGVPVCGFFVRGGEIADVKAPLGSYRVKYACGTTWYGTSYLFGGYTTYSQADGCLTFEIQGDTINGYTLTLSNVQNGNLNMTHIQAGDF